MFLLLLVQQQCVYTVINSQDSNAVYQILFMNLQFNNLHPGDNVGFGGGQRLMVVDMLRKIREYPVYDNHALMIKFNGDMRVISSYIHQEVAYLANSLVDYLVRQSLLNDVTFEFKNRLIDVMADFMQTSVVGLPADGYNVTNAQVEKYYLEYWKFRKQEYSMSLQERYEACKSYSFPLLYNLRDRYYQGVVPKEEKGKELKPRPESVRSNHKMVFDITGPGGSVGKYFAPTERAYLIGRDGIRYEFVDVVLDHTGSGMSRVSNRYQKFAGVDSALLTHIAPVVTGMVDLWGTLVATHVATVLADDIEEQLLMKEDFTQKGGGIKQALDLALLLL